MYAYSVARVTPRASAACCRREVVLAGAHIMLILQSILTSLTASPNIEGMREGLEGVVAASTRLSHVDGEAGRLTIAGYAVEDLAPHASFEEVAYLLLHGRLPDASERVRFAQDLAERRALSRAAVEVLREAAAAKAPPMDALRMAAPLLSLGREENPLDDAMTAIASFPTIVGSLLADSQR